MKVQFQQCDAVTQPVIIILSQQLTPDMEAIITRLKDRDESHTDTSHHNTHARNGRIDIISGTYGTQTSLIPVSSITHFYTHEKKVYARFAKQDWQVSLTLKYLEEKLDPAVYLRVSNSAIINMNTLVRFDVNLTGHYLAILRDGSRVKVSSRAISSVKKWLLTRS